MIRKIAPLLALAGLFALPACDWGKKREDEVLPLNNAAEDVVDNATQNVAEATATPSETVNISNVVTPPPPPPVTEDQQTLDDADATGLTSRLPEEDGLDEAAGNTAR